MAIATSAYKEGRANSPWDRVLENPYDQDNRGGYPCLSAQDYAELKQMLSDQFPQSRTQTYWQQFISLDFEACPGWHFVYLNRSRLSKSQELWGVADQFIKSRSVFKTTTGGTPKPVRKA